MAPIANMIPAIPTMIGAAMFLFCFVATVSRFLRETVMDLAGKIHKDFVEQLKTARVWGEGVYAGQLVKRDHILHDGDVVELHV